MSKKNLKKILDLHTMLNQDHKKNAKSFVGKDFERLSRYSSNFKKSLPKKSKQVDLQSICKKINKSTVVMFGDFHTLRKTQDSLVELLETYHKHYKRKKIIVALEAFQRRDQQHIDDYLSSKISEKKLLENTSYEKNWGFPWENYKSIVNFAKNNNIKLTALNHIEKDLRTRDEKIAETIADQIQKNPTHLIICVIGEHHLADDHLPAYLNKENLNGKNKLQLTRVISNIDSYFFKTKDYDLLLPVNYLQLKPDFFCIINTPPWIKWFSYILWEESEKKTLPAKTNSKEYVLEIDHDHFEFEYHFLLYINYLSKFFDIGTKNKLYNVTFKKATTHNVRDKLLKSSFDYNGILIKEKESVILIRDMCLSVLFFTSGQWLFIKETKNNSTSQPNRIAKEILKTTIGNLSIKLFNPCYEIKRNELSKKFNVSKDKKRSLQYYKKFYNTLINQCKEDSTIVSPLGDALSIELYHLLVRKDQKIFESIRNIFFEPTSYCDYEKRFLQLLKLCR